MGVFLCVYSEHIPFDYSLMRPHKIDKHEMSWLATNLCLGQRFPASD